MARILINAVNLRSGGGIQIIGGLLSKFGDHNQYEVIWNDVGTKDKIAAIAGQRPNVMFTRATMKTSNAAAFYWLMTQFPKWVSNNAPDIILGVNHFFPSGNIPQIIYHMNALRFQRPENSVFSMTELADRLRDWRAAVALKRARYNVFESKYLAGLAELGGAISNAKTIYIGLDDKKTENFSNSPDFDRGKILAVTSPAPHKDNATLIRMLSVLVKRNPDVNWRLFIAGGQGEKSFETLVRQSKVLGVYDRLHWLGYVDHRTLAQHGQTAQCVVSASRVESFCMVALEAMSWSCPAIVSDATSMPESVEKAGLIAPPGDEEAFAAHVIMLGEDKAFRQELIERGLKLSSKRTWSQAAREFERLWIE